MSSVVNPSYTVPANLESKLVEDEVMQDSPSSAGTSSATAGSGVAHDPLQDVLPNHHTTNTSNGMHDEENEETVKFADDF